MSLGFTKIPALFFVVMLSTQLKILKFNPKKIQGRILQNGALPRYGRKYKMKFLSITDLYFYTKETRRCYTMKVQYL